MSKQEGSGMKKIVIVGSAHPLRGGISTFNERLSRALNESGYQSVIYNFSLQYPSIFFPGSNQYTEEPAPDGIDIRIRINSINPVNWLKVGDEIRKLAPGLVIFRYWIPFMAPCFGTIARRIRKNKNIRIIAIADNIVPHEARIGDRLLTKYFVSSMDGFLTMSKIVEKSLSGFDTVKPRVLTPHPLYDNFGKAVPKKHALDKLGLSDNYKYLLFFGFIRDYKGLDLLLEALTDERLQKMPLKLIVAGEFYTRPDSYLEFIRKHELDEKVLLFTKFIPNSEVPLYFSACDLVVQPYKSATQSGVTQVALHFDKPIVTTNVGGLADMVSDGVVGYVVSPGKTAIAGAINRVFEKQELEKFTKNIAVEKQRFSWENMVSSIERLVGMIKK
jgi:D-inositol-3-phosphate glycosyltransferase